MRFSFEFGMFALSVAMMLERRARPNRRSPAVPAAVNWRGCSTSAAGRDGAAGCIAAAYRIGDQRVEPAARRLWLSRPRSR